MSSPIYQPEDLDDALKYAPPWAREQSFLPPSERPPHFRRGRTQPSSAGDRAMAELQRQLALHPDKVPEPPFEDARKLWPMALRLCGVTGFAAAVAWALVSASGTRKVDGAIAQSETARPTLDSPSTGSKLVHFRSPQETFLRCWSPDSLADYGPNPARCSKPTLTAEITAAAASSAPSAASRTPRASTTAKSPRSSSAVGTLLQNGDLASARLLLQRAAESGSASAALALGSSYRPVHDPASRRSRHKPGHRPRPGMVPKGFGSRFGRRLRTTREFGAIALARLRATIT